MEVRSQVETSQRSILKDKYQSNFLQYLLAFSFTTNKYLYFGSKTILLT